MNEDKMREEYMEWKMSDPTTISSDWTWEAWKAACASKQKEIDDLIDASALAYKCSEQESLDRIRELEAKLRELRKLNASKENLK